VPFVISVVTLSLNILCSLSKSPVMSPTESNTRGIALLACMLGGCLLMIPAAWLGNELLIRVELAPWLESVIGIIIAFLPMILLGRFAVKCLDRRYPDSPPGRIPEAHERPSAHRRHR